MASENNTFSQLITIKASLLSHGIAFSPEFFTRIKAPYYSNQFVYGQTSDAESSLAGLPQLLLLGKGVNVSLIRRSNSPWRLESQSGQLTVNHKDGRTFDVSLPERPGYFGHKLSTGDQSENVIAVAGEDTPGFFFYPNCFYFEEGKPCRFCGIKKTRRTVGRKLACSFSNELIREATKLFKENQWRPLRHVSVTTGTCRTDNETRSAVLEPLKLMREVLGPNVPVHILASPPNDLSIIEEYKAAGVTTIAFNLEVFDRDIFGELCPGKSELYGYEAWLEALWQARDVFGEFKVFCGLVWGLEPVQSTIAGHRYFLEHGIAIASNVFHADPTCLMRNHPHPTESDILTIAEHELLLFQQYPDARPIFEVSMRSTLDWEIYKESKE